MKKKLAAAAVFLCMVGATLPVSADELDVTATNESGLSSMHGISGKFEEYSEEDVEIPSSIKVNQAVQAIRLTANEIWKLYSQKHYIETTPMEDNLYLRIDHFSIYLLQK